MTRSRVLIYSSLVIILIFQVLWTIEFSGGNGLDYSSYKVAGASSATEGSDGPPGSPSFPADGSLWSSSNSSSNDVFGVKKIYPTKNGGREWFINMDDPRGDGIFFITSDLNITRQADDSWRINNTNVRMNVDTLPNMAPWRDVEITGYARIVGKVPIDSNSRVITDDFDLNWLARGGRHSSDFPCEGSALTAILDINGIVGWKKEIWFPGGYADERNQNKVVSDSLLNRWIGFKAIMYNINNNTAVKMESYIDNKDTNYWVQVTNLSDTGDWYAKSPDNEFNSAGCGKPKNYIINNSGPIVTFRTDNIVWDFKDLSVREIQAPRPTDSSSYSR